MTPELAIALMQTTLPGLRLETQTTRRVLAAVPDDQAAYKPHETSMSALELVQHLAFSDLYFLDSIIKGEFARPDDAVLAKLDTPSKVVAVYDAQLPKLLEALAKLSGEHLVQSAQFLSWNLPLISYLNFAMSHAIHHRGQLSVYLRPMGAKVPSIYGGSADEPRREAAAQG
jgi:uncharacterized damage-inducible protein DinB